MTRSIGCDHDFQRLPNEQETDIILRVQTYCADLASEGGEWTEADGIALGKMFNEASDPFDLFRFVDEKTGHFTVGYRTRDGREWFHILRQMRNKVGSGLLETMMGPFDHHTADGHPVVRPDGPEAAEGGITPEGQDLGHRYVMGNVNAYCPKCSEEQGVAVLDCDYDLDK